MQCSKPSSFLSVLSSEGKLSCEVALLTPVGGGAGALVLIGGSSFMGPV